ncbi:maleylpyruvate isomerase family mycothiol-dependent enzyme [Pseudonocardia xinjiangensis]|uniref:maleylpyruvate isomerase family mycothiol-dependent enzyme n=1 Tax=Pseudonocardia xinjiangensis TaxID=75289 RepID=UPI003D949255
MKITGQRAAYGLATEFDPFRRIEADTLALADAAEGHLASPVPSCPAWSVADLVWHLLEVQHFWGAIVAGRVQDPATVPDPVRPDDADLVPGLRAGVAGLVESLRGAEPGDPVYTWAARRDAGFVVRHQVQEAAVHRWDAERATGRESPLDATAATDAVEEFLEVSTPFRTKDAAPVGGTLQLVAVDTGFRWQAAEDHDGAARWQRLAGGGADQAGGADGPDADVVVRATASDLLLYLYRRRPAGALDVTGDLAVAERFALRTGTD